MVPNESEVDTVQAFGLKFSYSWSCWPLSNIMWRWLRLTLVHVATQSV